MKAKYFIHLLMFAAVYFASTATAQNVSVNLKSGKTINGHLKSMTVNEIALDPEGAVELLVIDAGDISSLIFIKSKKTLKYPISEDQIPAELRKKKYRKPLSTNPLPTGMLIGPKAGLNFSTWYGDGSEGAVTKPGFHGGVMFQLPIDEELIFQPEIEYSREGAKYDEMDDFQIDLNYLNFPLLFKYRQASGFFYEAGLLYGILLSAHGKLGRVKVDVKDEFKKSNLALIAGLGYQSASNFGFKIGANLGLKNVSADSETPVANGVLQLSAFYLFNPGSRS